jgi:CRISPR-associated endonuclease/helicase Cas3
VPINNEAIEIWEEYKSIVQNKELDFTNKKIKLKKLSSKLSKYTFSLAIYRGSGIDYLKPYGVEEFGYLYLEEYENIYSYENGLDTSVLSGENVPLII